jgi:hypothetical protein
MTKPILCLDFDGVCHSYTSGWQGAAVIPDPPVPGLFEFLSKAHQYFEIHIFSSRSHQLGGIEAMQTWFRHHMSVWVHGSVLSPMSSQEEALLYTLPGWLHFDTVKPAAAVSIDDRAITFTGQWPSIDFLITFQPWNKKET